MTVTKPRIALLRSLTICSGAGKKREIPSSRSPYTLVTGVTKQSASAENDNRNPHNQSRIPRTYILSASRG